MTTDRERAKRVLYPIHRVVPIEYEELNRTAQARVDRITALIAEVRRETVAPVRELHRPFKVYDECDHRHTEEDVRAGRAVSIWEIGLTCEDGFLYKICVECCTDSEYQTEECGTNHKHGKDTPICATIAALDGAQ